MTSWTGLYRNQLQQIPINSWLNKRIYLDKIANNQQTTKQTTHMQIIFCFFDDKKKKTTQPCFHRFASSPSSQLCSIYRNVCLTC